MMKRLFVFWALILQMISGCMAQGDNICKVKISLPQRLFMNAKTADMALTALTEEGETDLAIVQLKAEGGVMKGEWSGGVKGTYAGSMSYVMDPHVAFGLIIEPGEISVTGDNNDIKVQGTKFNEVYGKYEEDIRKAVRTHERDSVIEAYIKEYGDTPLMVALYGNHSALNFEGNKEKAEQLWTYAGENMRKIKPLLETYNRVCHNNVSNGEELRDVTIPNATVEGEGKTVKLSDYIGKGKWVFVDFWASWCGGCRQAIPLVKEAYAELKDKNIQFISIAEWDRRSAALKAMAEENMPWLQLIDEKGACGTTYMFNTIPRFMLFAPDGTLEEKDVERNKIKSLLRAKLGVTE